MSRRSVLAFGLVAALVLAPFAAYSAQASDLLDSWAPTDGAWSQTESFDSEGSRGDCVDGRLTRWVNEVGDVTTLIWAQCGDATTAAALLNLTWASNVMFPADSVTSAFGDGLELVSPFSTFDGLTRLWTQDEWFLSVSRTCPEGGRPTCDAATAAYAQDISRLIAAPVDPVVPVERVAGDLAEGWVPSDPNGWRIASAGAPLQADLERCLEGAFTTWTGLDGGIVEVFWVRCSSTRDAFRIQYERWLTLTDTTGLASALGPGYDRFARFDANGAPSVTRSWVQGDLYVNVQRTCPFVDISVCASSTAQYALELVTVIPGEVMQDTTILEAAGEAGWLFFVVPILTFLLLIVPQRVYFWWRSRGFSAETSNPNFRSVDSLVVKVRLLRLLRRVVLSVLVLVAWWFGLAILGFLGPWLVLWVFLSPFVMFAVFGAVLRLVWKPHALISVTRRRYRPTAMGVIGSTIRATASVIAGFAVVLYFFASLLLITDRQKTTETVEAEVADGLQSADPLYFAFSAMRSVVHALDDAGTYFLVFLLMLVVPVTFAYLLDRFGQRLTRRSLHATLAVDNRPYFLYLRGFDEDKLRIDESVGKRGFLELFTPFARPRFEEVLVEYLTHYGPVIAIAGSKQVLSDLGAAKVSLGNDEWRSKVEQWSAGARAVVMSATPREVRAGLEWEMQHVAANASGVRLMLVLSPWPRGELARRWAGFLERASEWPLFRPLAETPMPSGVEVMTYAPGRGWRGYGARRRWDWSYAASIITAMESGDFDLPSDRAAEGD